MKPVTLLLALLILCGCSPASTPTRLQPSTPPIPGFPVTFRDDSGREVTLAAPPRRIVSLAPAHTETLYALGVGDRVIAADSYSDFPPDAKAKATLECWPQPPLERIAALKPDLVVVLTQEGDFLRAMEGARIPVLKIFPKRYEGALEGIRQLGRAVGAPEAAERIAGGMERQTAAIEGRLRGVKPVRFLYELDAVDPQRPYVAGSGGFYGELFRRAGGENVFEDLKAPSAQVSAEQVVARNPAVLLLGDTQSPQSAQTPELLLNRPGWATIEAVRRKLIYPINDQRITRPGPRLVEGLEEVARVFHPERFR